MGVKGINIKQRIEQNVIVWLLGTLLTGFLSGIGVYRAIQEIAGVRILSKAEVEASKQTISDLEGKLVKSDAHAAAQLRLAYLPVRGRWVRIIYTPPYFELALGVQEKLLNMGANAQTYELKNNSRKFSKKLIYHKNSMESAMLIQRLLADVISLSTEQSDEIIADNLDIIIWATPKWGEAEGPSVGKSQHIAP